MHIMCNEELNKGGILNEVENTIDSKLINLILASFRS